MSIARLRAPLSACISEFRDGMPFSRWLCERLGTCRREKDFDRISKPRSQFVNSLPMDHLARSCIQCCCRSDLLTALGLFS